jgi:hypothetical protein
LGTIPAFASRTQENQENLPKPRKPEENQENVKFRFQNVKEQATRLTPFFNMMMMTIILQRRSIQYIE